MEAKSEALVAREGMIESVFMTPEQRQVFEIFIGLGAERSLEKLITTLATMAEVEGLKTPSGSTIKRWSSKFKWFELATRTDAEIVAGIAAGALPVHRERTAKALRYIEKMKDTFYKAVDAGTVEVDLPQFVLLLKTEALLLGDPTERREEVHTHKLAGELQLTDTQLRAVLRLTAAKEFGLPVPETIEGETVST
jgi:hypothetical protein